MKLLCVFGRHAYGNIARGAGYEHTSFLPALHALGHETVLFESFDRSRYRDFGEMNRAFVRALRDHAPDAVLCVLMSYELWTETLELARALCAGPIVNWGTDDSWKYQQFGRFVAPHVDCYATTSVTAFEQASNECRTNVVLTQWAATDATLAQPLPAAQCRYQVTFVGAAYGNRRRRIAELARRGVKVECFGHGWPNGPVKADDVQSIARQSIISLNFGDSGLHFRGIVPYRSRQIKARVFEVPGAGGFLLSEPADGLERFYEDRAEIAVFRHADDLAAKIRFYLAHPEERDRIARAGHERTARQHIYTRRFEELFAHAFALKLRAPRATLTIAAADNTLEGLVRQYRSGVALRALRVLLVVPFALLFGRVRGARAARRLLFELSWRLAGAKTYKASGWPGRIFYRES